MIMDDNLEFADATSVGTPNNTTVNVGDVIDLDVARDLAGGSKPLWLVVIVTTAIVGTTSTVRFKLVSDSVATPAVDGTQTEHITSDSIAEALLIVGFEFKVPLPSEDPAYERFLGFQVEEDSGNVLTAGAVNAFLTHDARKYRTYADAIN